MAIAVLLGQSGRGAGIRNPLDVDVQSRTPKYGLGWHYPETAAGHGRMTLLLTPVKNGGITPAGTMAQGGVAA